MPVIAVPEDGQVAGVLPQRTQDLRTPESTRVARNTAAVAAKAAMPKFPPQPPLANVAPENSGTNPAENSGTNPPENRQTSRSATRSMLTNVRATDIGYDMWELLWCMNKQAPNSEWFMPIVGVLKVSGSCYVCTSSLFFAISYVCIYLWSHM
jgi:hypothetical protein